MFSDLSRLQTALIAALLLSPQWAFSEEEKSSAQLRHEIEAANQLVYKIFNELNPDDDYDIECKKEARLGSQLLRTYCRTRISWESRSPWDEAEDRLSTSRQPSSEAAHNRILREKMLALAKANPPLMNAIVQRKLLQRELDSREE